MTAQRHQAETKQKLLSAFNSHFLLTDAELTTLTSTAEPVTDAFFDALARAKKIHHDCQVLLGTEIQHLGLEILDQSSKQLNAAFQKLFRWTQRELKTIDLENPQLSISVRKALRVLAERPALFQSCLDFFAESREHILSDAFYSALTGAPTEGAATTVAIPSKAIELNAHDPLRYVSDMLAWAHAAVVGEREALQILFISDGDEISKSIQAGRESQPWLAASVGPDGASLEAAFDGKKALSELVDRDLSGVLRQLRQRIEQIVHSHEDATLAYQISNLITFYCSIFSSLLGEGSATEQTLQPVTDVAMQHFRTTMRDHIINLHSDATSLTSDLSPPEFLEEALETLRGLMKSYDTSFTSATSSKEKTEGFQAVLAEALDPYLAGCENMAKRMNAPEGDIFAMNCLTATRIVANKAAFTAAKVTELDQTIEDHEGRLIHAVHAWFVGHSGMQSLLDALEPFSEVSSARDVQELAKLDVLQPATLAETAHQLDDFLPTAMEDARSFIGLMTDKAAVRDVCERAAELFTEEYENVERLLSSVDQVQQPSRGEDDGNEEAEESPILRDIFPRTSDEIKVLLS